MNCTPETVKFRLFIPIETYLFLQPSPLILYQVTNLHQFSAVEYKSTENAEIWCWNVPNNFFIWERI